MGSWNKYFQDNHDELVKIVYNITKGHSDSDDLYQFVVIMILEKNTEIPDSQKKYFFIRAVKNNWFSSTSPYEYQFRRKVYNHNETTDYNFEILEYEEYSESLKPSLEWIRETLNTFHWYKRDLFLMWMELQSVTEISKKTTIPMNTCGRHIREIKQELNELWDLQNCS